MDRTADTTRHVDTNPSERTVSPATGQFDVPTHRHPNVLTSAPPFILGVLLLATLACSSSPNPITSESQQVLSLDQAKHHSQEYLSINLWAEIAHRTATGYPQNFHQVLTPGTNPHCAATSSRPDQPPDAAIQQLLDCAASTTDPSSTQRWNSLTRQQKEAHAQRAFDLLWESSSPPGLITARLAAERGLNVNPQNDSRFAGFAANYEVCSQIIPQHTASLAEASTPQHMADIWLHVEHHLRDCANTVTQQLLPFR